MNIRERFYSMLGLKTRSAHAGMPPMGAHGRTGVHSLLSRALMAIALLTAKVLKLENRVKELEDENQRLYEAANLGSDTSGIPSSKGWKADGVCDGPEETAGRHSGRDGESGKPKTEAPIQVTGYINGAKGARRKAGGQKNHAPAFMGVDGAQERDPVHHYPQKCADCPNKDQCIEEGRLRRSCSYHEYDVEVIKVHREHFAYEAAGCPQGGGPAVGAPSEEVVGYQYYGTNVQLLVVIWHHFFHGGYERIRLAARELLGLSLGAGTANATIQRASAKILKSRFVDALRFYFLLFEKAIGVDETSARVGGRNAWVHTTSTANATLLSAHWRRGYEGTVYAGIVQFFIYTLISDCWSAYFNAKLKCKNAICLGHVLRELVAAAYFRRQAWAVEMFDLLLEILEAKRDAVERGARSLPQGYIDGARARFRQILADGFDGIPGETKGKTHSLLERLRKLEDAVFAFAVDFDVDFTNNASEISLRDVKVALRVIGQFKTMPGLVDYCLIQSFMDTCRKQGRNPYDMLRVLFAGGDIIEAVFGAEKAGPIKQMIILSDAMEAGDESAAEAAAVELGPALTQELVDAAAYGPYRAFNGPPPEKKDTAPEAPKDKMEAARAAIALNKPSQAAAAHAGLPQGGAGNMQRKSSQRTRAGPNIA